MRTGTRSVGFLACLLCTNPAWAQTPFEALLQECYSLRTRNRSAAALDPCRRAVVMSRNGRSLAQLGLTEMALGQWVEAANHISEALTDPSQQEPERRRALDTAMQSIRPRVAELVVDTNDPTASVTVDGRAVPTGARPVFAAAGTVRLVVRPREGDEVTRLVELTLGRPTHETVQFAAAATTTEAQRVEVQRNVGGGPAVTAPTIVSPAARARVGSTQRALAWTAGGLAVAGFALSLVGWRLREGAVSDYLAQCPSADIADRMVFDQCTPRHATLLTVVDQWQTVTTVGLVAGGVFAVASAVLFTTTPGSRRTDARAVRCGGGPGLVGVGCVVAF